MRRDSERQIDAAGFGPTSTSCWAAMVADRSPFRAGRPLLQQRSRPSAQALRELPPHRSESNRFGRLEVRLDPVNSNSSGRHQRHWLWTVRRKNLACSGTSRTRTAGGFDYAAATRPTSSRVHQRVIRVGDSTLLRYCEGPVSASGTSYSTAAFSRSMKDGAILAPSRRDCNRSRPDRSCRSTGSQAE